MNSGRKSIQHYITHCCFTILKMYTCIVHIVVSTSERYFIFSMKILLVYCVYNYFIVHVCHSCRFFTNFSFIVLNRNKAKQKFMQTEQQKNKKIKNKNVRQIQQYRDTFILQKNLERSKMLVND